MKKILAVFLAVLACLSLGVLPAAADCWNWSISEQNLSVTLTGHTPDTAETVSVPAWYTPSSQSARDAIQTVISVLKASAFTGRPGAAALIQTYESTGRLPVSVIGDHVFENHKSMKQVSLPESVFSIGEYAFLNCYNLEKVNIPQGVTLIRDGTFASCNRLRNIALPSGLTSIGKSAFESCTALNDLIIPSSVTEIGYAAFSGCAALQALRLENGLEQIGDFAFYGCSGLQWVSIPKSVSYISDSAFSGCHPVIYTMNSYVIDYANSHGLTWQFSERTW